MVTINHLVDYALQASGKKLSIKHIDGPTGVRGRNSDNKLYYEKMGYYPKYPLKVGIKKTYDWIVSQLTQ
jgi:nucleoside-diphosphate-sugar epimerase